MNVAVIVAAGTGTRFGGDLPKQFVPLAGRPLIVHTVERFERCGSVDAIVIVTSPEHAEMMRGLVAEAGFEKVVEVVDGGATRAESVNNGFEAARRIGCGVVGVHDGARPLVSCAEIEAVMSAARRDGAACLVAPVTDTIKQVEFGKIVRTIDRNSLRRALTPQAFQVDVLHQAIVSTDLDASVTDESMLVERAGFEVTAVEGSPVNIKVTHPEDLLLAEALLKGISDT